jgi:hypothetical protein
MKQLLQIRCWSCHDVFTISAEPEATDPPSANLIDVSVPCPYCAKANRVTVSQEQVRTVTVHRGGAAVDLSQPDALREQVFDGQEP